MASRFPRLSSGVVAQHPATRELEFTTEIRRFADLSEQRYREQKRPRRRWRIELDEVNDTEQAVLVNFFHSMRGSFGTFEFEDPWTGSVVENCRFGEDIITVRSDRELAGRITLTVVEIL